MEQKYGFLELVFFEDASKNLKKIVKDVVTPEQFYYSDTISKINGDVTDKIHFTIFYGLEESALTNPDLQKHVEEIKIKELHLTKLFLFNGYQGMYNVLCVEVADEDGKLLELSQKMLEFEHNTILGQRQFRPHITLAYVQPDYTIPKDYTIEEKTIKVKKAQLSI